MAPGGSRLRIATEITATVLDSGPTAKEVEIARSRSPPSGSRTGFFQPVGPRRYFIQQRPLGARFEVPGRSVWPASKNLNEPWSTDNCSVRSLSAHFPRARDGVGRIRRQIR